MYTNRQSLLVRAAAALGLFAVAFIATSGAKAQQTQTQFRNSVLNGPALARSGGSGPYREALDIFLNKKQKKIVGGTIVASGHPWQVSLGISWIVNPQNAHFCGGSVLSRTFILTAAHCLVDTPPQNIAVTAGTLSLQRNSLRVNVLRVIIHPRYDPKSQDNDIGMLELIEPLPEGANIAAIRVLTAGRESDTVREGRTLTVTGWGATAEGSDKTPLQLRQVLVPYVPREMCNGLQAYDGRITENMFCAGLTVGGKDSCQGDSGGPLTHNATGSTPVQVGIVSWGEGCARPGKYGVYTRIANYTDWIRQCLAEPEGC